MSAGLHDYPEELPSIVVTEAEIHAKWREWGFWGAMAIGLWSAFQGMAILAFWFTAVIMVVVAIKVVAGPLASEVSQTWRG